MNRNIIKIISIGFLAGVFSGLLGVGGGIIMVPAMVLLLGLSQHEAHGTSLLVIVGTSLVGSIGYYIAGNLELNYALWIVIGSLLGAYLGSLLATRLSGKNLRLIYVIFLIFVGIKMVIG